MTHPSGHPSPSTRTSAEATSERGPGVRVRVYACTDVGRTREHNEDAFLVADLETDAPEEFDAPGRDGATRELVPGARGVLFMVADGLGGAAAGEVASHMAVDAVFEALRGALAPAAVGPDTFATALRDAALAANEAIHRRARQHRELHGMGTTVTAAALLGDALFVAQVGDSRAYLVRDGVAQQITKDQSLMQKLVEAGEITPEQAEHSARRNIILQALGPEQHVKVDLTRQPLRRGDVLVLCSDGLSGQVRADEIADVAARAADLDELCAELVDRANERGGPDNITVVAAHFGGALEAPREGDPVGHRIYALPDQTTEEPAVPGRPTETVVREPLAPAAWGPPSLETLSAAIEARLGPLAPDSPASRPAGAAEPRLAERETRARRYIVVLAVAALLVALFALWRLLRR